MSTVITSEHLSKWYGQVIGLNDVTVSVPKGITGLLGPNGAGNPVNELIRSDQANKGGGQGAGERSGETQAVPASASAREDRFYDA